MKISLDIKHNPDSYPGEWKDSTLTLKITADKNTVTKVEEAIKQALINSPVSLSNG